MNQMKFHNKIITITAALALQAAVTIPVLAQSTTLTGSVLSNRTVTNLPEPVLQSQTAQFDNRAVQQTARAVQQSPRTASPRPRTVTKTVTRTVYVEKQDNRTYFQKHPKVKSAVVGAGVGAGVGAATGLIARRGVLRGAAIGAGTGAGVGLVRSSDTMKRHPIVKNTATGALAGLGLGAAAGRRGSTKWKSAGVGTAIGLGYGLFKHLR